MSGTDAACTAPRRKPLGWSNVRPLDAPATVRSASIYGCKLSIFRGTRPENGGRSSNFAGVDAGNGRHSSDRRDRWPSGREGGSARGEEGGMSLAPVRVAS
eukprot:1847932-Rhodomonas_salina.2